MFGPEGRSATRQYTKLAALRCIGQQVTIARLLRLRNGVIAAAMGETCGGALGRGKETDE